MFESRRIWDELCIERISTHPNVLDPISRKRFLVGWNIHRQFQKFSPIRREFLTLPQARSALQKRPKWSEDLRGDLQKHSKWGDGPGAVPEIAAAAEERSTNIPRSPIIRLRIAKAAGVHRRQRSFLTRAKLGRPRAGRLIWCFLRGCEGLCLFPSGTRKITGTRPKFNRPSENRTPR